MGGLALVYDVPANYLVKTVVPPCFGQGNISKVGQQVLGVTGYNNKKPVKEKKRLSHWVTLGSSFGNLLRGSSQPAGNPLGLEPPPLPGADQPAAGWTWLEPGNGQ